jgi:enamine deaminase RidA (YjgF/YER057c/UK114 family)
MRLWLLLLLVAAPPLAAAPAREHLAPEGWEGSYHRIHYTPVVKLGDRVIISGIPAGQGDTEEAKIRWAFRELERHLAEAGATMADVVELTSFHVARDHAEFRERMEPVLKVHAEFFRSHYPAWTAVGTTALFSEGAPMEIRAEAVIGSGKRAKLSIPEPGAPPRSP